MASSSVGSSILSLQAAGMGALLSRLPTDSSPNIKTAINGVVATAMPIADMSKKSGGGAPALDGSKHREPTAPTVPTIMPRAAVTAPTTASLSVTSSSAASTSTTKTVSAHSSSSASTTTTSSSSTSATVDLVTPTMASNTGASTSSLSSGGPRTSSSSSSSSSASTTTIDLLGWPQVKRVSDEWSKNFMSQWDKGQSILSKIVYVFPRIRSLFQVTGTDGDKGKHTGGYSEEHKGVLLLISKGHIDDFPAVMGPKKIKPPFPEYARGVCILKDVQWLIKQASWKATDKTEDKTVIRQGTRVVSDVSVLRVNASPQPGWPFWITPESGSGDERECRATLAQGLAKCTVTVIGVVEPGATQWTPLSTPKETCVLGDELTVLHLPLKEGIWNLLPDRLPSVFKSSDAHLDSKKKHAATKKRERKEEQEEEEEETEPAVEPESTEESKPPTKVPRTTKKSRTEKESKSHKTTEHVEETAPAPTTTTTTASEDEKSIDIVSSSPTVMATVATTSVNSSSSRKKKTTEKESKEEKKRSRKSKAGGKEKKASVHSAGGDGQDKSEVTTPEERDKIGYLRGVCPKKYQVAEPAFLWSNSKYGDRPTDDELRDIVGDLKKEVDREIRDGLRICVHPQAAKRDQRIEVWSRSYVSYDPEQARLALLYRRFKSMRIARSIPAATPLDFSQGEYVSDILTRLFGDSPSVEKSYELSEAEVTDRTPAWMVAWIAEVKNECKNIPAGYKVEKSILLCSPSAEQVYKYERRKRQSVYQSIHSSKVTSQAQGKIEFVDAHLFCADPWDEEKGFSNDPKAGPCGQGRTGYVDLQHAIQAAQKSHGRDSADTLRILMVRMDVTYPIVGTPSTTFFNAPLLPGTHMPAFTYCDANVETGEVPSVYVDGGYSALPQVLLEISVPSSSSSSSS